MKKNEFANTVKRKIDHKTLNDLIKRKENHSKVKVLKHPVLKMQNYLTANNHKLRIEDCQNIFKMRCKVTKTKVNMKQMYNTLECRACRIESESDCHVLKCSKILKMNQEYENIEIPDYEKLYTGSPNEQLEISRIFSSNMKILENIKEDNLNLSTLCGPCDQSNYFVSAVYTD